MKTYGPSLHSRILPVLLVAAGLAPGCSKHQMTLDMTAAMDLKTAADLLVRPADLHQSQGDLPRTQDLSMGDLPAVQDLARQDLPQVTDLTTPNVIHVGPGKSFTFSPAALTVAVGSTVTWVFSTGGHNVVSGADCLFDGTLDFCSPSDTDCPGALSAAGATYQHTFNETGTFPYFCSAHCVGLNMQGTVTVK